jgi:hypothetical protein
MATLPGITITVDAQPVITALAGIRNGFARAGARAINRSITTVNAQASREIAKDIGLPVTQVKRSMRIIRARFESLVGSVEVTGRRIPIEAFAARQTRRGVTYRGRGGGRKLIPGAFRAQMPSGHRGVFLRRGKARLPIAEKFGPSLPKVASNAAITATMRRVAEEAMRKNLLAEVKFLISSRKGA